MTQKRNIISLAAMLIAAGAAVALSLESLVRNLWYDEALTVLEFALLEDCLAIYKKYTIPNNHILYTMIFKQWINFAIKENGVDVIIRMRFLTLLMSCGIAAVLISAGRRKAGLLYGAALCSVYLLSWPFSIYSCSIRGYMLSALAALFGLWALSVWKKTRSLQGGAFFFISCFTAVAAIPSNILVFSAFSMHLLLTVKKLRKSDFIVAALPFVTLLFYAGIYEQFFALLSQKRGWESALSCLYHCFGGYIFTALPLICAACAGIFINYIRKKRISRAGLLFFVLILIPLLTVSVLPRTPYPRVFLPFFPVLLVASLCSARPLFCWLSLAVFKGKKYTACVFLAVCMIFSLLMFGRQEYFSKIFTPAGEQDDLIQPYYVKKTFSPDLTVLEVKKIYESDSSVRFYVSPDADPISLLFMGRLAGLKDDVWEYKKPGRPLSHIRGSGFPSYAIVRSADQLQDIKSSFNLSGSFKKTADFGFHKLYIYKK
ncbi:MAG: hypothetical protein ACYTFY_04810 [Planctomycetota bacterium]|jgi:hypothetical protein